MPKPWTPQGVERAAFKAETEERIRELLREAFETLEGVRYQFCLKAGISTGTLGSFLGGGHGIAIGQAAYILNCLGYRLVMNIEKIGEEDSERDPAVSEVQADSAQGRSDR